MRVALVDPRGDSRPYDHELAAALAARGHTVELASCRFAHSDLPGSGAAAVSERFYRIADRAPRRLRRVARGIEHPLDLVALATRLARFRPDVVHVQWLPLEGVDRAAWRALRRTLRVPLVFTAHNAVPRDASPKTLRRAAATAGLFDRVIAHTRYGADGLVRVLGLDPARVVEIPHGVLAGYRDLAPVRPPLPDDVPVVAFLGLVRPYKGLGDLLDAWPSVRARLPGALLYVGGRPMGDPAVEQIPSTAGVVADLRYLSSGEFAGALRRADVVCLPYRAIDQSGVLFAALALRRPLVVTDVGGFAETVGARGLGLVVPPGDPAALAQAIVRLLDDRALRAQVGEAQLEAAEGIYSWTSIAERTERVYEEVVR